MSLHGAIQHNGAPTWADAMAVGGGAGSEFVGSDPLDPVVIGSTFLFSSYFANEGFFSFDTSAELVEPATATLELSLTVPVPAATSLIIAAYDWGASLASADWRNPAAIPGLTVAGTLALTGTENTGDILSVDIDPATIVLGGTTRFVAYDSNMATNTAPTDERQFIVDNDDSGGVAPVLTVEGTGGGLDPPPDPPDPVIIDVVDIEGNVITNLPLAWCESITRTKNQPDEATIKFPKYAYTRDDVHVFADDTGSGDLHEIRVMRSGTVRFWGPAVSADTNSSDGQVTLHCKGVDWYLTRRYINGQRTNLLTNGSFETGDETGWTAAGSMTHGVTTDDAVDGTHSLRLESITPLGDIFEYQNVSVTGTGVGTFITISAYFKLEGIGGHALDRRGLYVEGLVGSDVQTNNFYAIDEATPVGEFIRAKTSIQVPTLTTWDLNIRAYSPPGSILWDKLKVVAMQSVSTAGITGDTTTPVDVSLIVELVHNFVQDPTFGHSDVNIGLDNPTVGVKQVKHIQWADEISWPNQMSEWLDRDDCFDYSIVYTEMTRTLTLHVPNQGVDRRGDFTLTFPGNIASMSVTEDGGGTITDDTELDQDSGDGPDREEGHYADATQVGGLTLQAVNTAPQGASVASLDPIAREQVNKARRPALLYTFTLTNKDGTDYDELLGLGDLVDFAVTNGWASTSGYGAIAQLVEYPRNRRLEVTLAKAM